MVLLDHELGEVFGPSVFGEADPRERCAAGFFVMLSLRRLIGYDIGCRVQG